jgi:hypothetical protein
VGSTLFGMAITIGLAYYRGMVTGLLIQAVMTPLTVFAENPLVQAIIVKPLLRIFSGREKSNTSFLTLENRLFNEKLLSELSPTDEIVDGSTGQPVVRRTDGSIDVSSALANGKTANASTDMGAFENLLLDTWDSGTKADIQPLLQAITKKNVNFQTTENRWTALMIVSGLNCPNHVTVSSRVACVVHCFDIVN